MTVKDIYVQTQQLSADERQELFSMLLEDLAPDLPNSFHSDDELEKMLLEGLSSGPNIPATPEYWARRTERVQARLGAKRGTPVRTR